MIYTISDLAKKVNKKIKKIKNLKDLADVAVSVDIVNYVSLVRELKGNGIFVLVNNMVGVNYVNYEELNVYVTSYY